MVPDALRVWQGMLVTEMWMDRVARMTDQPLQNIRHLNLYQEMEKTHFGQILHKCQIQVCQLQPGFSSAKVTVGSCNTAGATSIISTVAALSHPNHGIMAFQFKFETGEWLTKVRVMEASCFPGIDSSKTTCQRDSCCTAAEPWTVSINKAHATPPHKLRPYFLGHPTH